jgi:hypothetical protein
MKLRQQPRRAAGRPDRLAGRQLRHDHLAATDDRQERPAARRRPARRRRSPRSSRSSRPTPSSVRSMPATPSRRCSRPMPRRSSPCAPPPSPQRPKAARASVESHPGGRRSRPFDLRRRRAVGLRPSGTDLGQDHHLRRPCARLGGEVQGGHPARRRQARRCRRRQRAPRSMPATRRTTGRSARPARSSRPISTSPRHLGRHPASRRHEGFEGHRRHQQGRGSADLPGRRLRPRRRSLRGTAGARKGALIRQIASAQFRTCE